MPVYTTSKAAVQGLTRSLARDLGPFNIRVNTLVPGWVMTERQITLWFDEKGREDVARGQCINQKLMPEHIARMAMFLAADDSAMCTAQDFMVDGGWVGGDGYERISVVRAAVDRATIVRADARW